MADFDAKADTPCAASAVAAGDKFPFGDVSADGWETILASGLLDALLRVAATAAGGSLISRSGNTIRVTNPNAASEYFEIDKTSTVSLLANTGGGLGRFVFATDLTISFSLGGGWKHYFTPTLHALVAAGAIAWTATANADDAPDVGIARAAAKVAKLTDGSTGSGTLSSIPVAWAPSGTVNDAAPGVARNYEITGASTPIVTSLVAGVNGEERYAVNVGATSVVFSHAAGTGTAANRFLCRGAADLTLAQYEHLKMVYSTTASRWYLSKF